MQVTKKTLTFYYRRIVSALKGKIGTPLNGSRKRKILKKLLIPASVLIVIAGIVIIFISPITKYLVEKYDLKYTGRQIKMDWAYVNPFTGYVHFNNLKIYELKSDSIFFSAKGVSANFAMRKMLSKTYEITELTLNQPHGIIIQIDKDLNFGDLIERFASKVDSIKVAAPVHFSILSIKIRDGEFYYRERVTPINYYITKVNIESTGIHWDTDTIAAKFSFLSGIGSGGMKGDFTINTKNMDFRLAVKIQKFDLEILEQYVRELSNYGYFSANLDADMHVKGNFKTAENVSFKGMLAINNFHAGENPKEDYASFDKLAIAIYELSPRKHKYLFDSVSLSNPFFKYERYDYLDNLQRIFVTEGANADGNSSSGKFNLILAIGNYIKDLSRNFFNSNYKLNRLTIYNGNLEYNDYSLSEKFSVKLNPIFVLADSINKNQKRVSVFFKSGLQPFGNATLSLSINPNDSSDFDLEYHLQKLPASMFNPYLITYTSFPLDRGTISLNGSWHVRNGIIKSDNHLLVIDPRVTKRVRNKDTKWIPLPLIMAFIRERGNVIDYEIPITGDLKNPKFHLRDAIVDILGNIFVKPLTTPYRIQVKNLEAEIEKSLTLKWEMRHSSLLPVQERFIERMATFLVKNPDASIAVKPQQYTIKEREYIMLFEAKKKYFLASNNKNAQSFSNEDSENVEKMSAKDAQFVKYMNNQTNDSMLFNVQDKCNRLLGTAFIDARYNKLNRERENAFLSYFKSKGVEKQVKISDEVSVIPYNGFSFYKIDYNGEYPEKLIKAYRKMNDLNDHAPRELFKKERRKNKGIL